MARTDPPLSVNVPRFVHQDLKKLLKQLGGEANKTRLVAALIHSATLESSRAALRAYSDELARRDR